MVHFDVPRLPVERLVVEYDELVGFTALRNKLTAGLVVVERGDDATFYLDAELIVLEYKDIFNDLSDCDSWLLCNLEGPDGKDVTVSTGNATCGGRKIYDLLAMPWQCVQGNETLTDLITGFLQSKDFMDIFQETFASLEQLSIKL
jgi:hypothetical protein